jgi:hypothetical protein
MTLNFVVICRTECQYALYKHLEYNNYIYLWNISKDNGLTKKLFGSVSRMKKFINETTCIFIFHCLYLKKISSLLPYGRMPRNGIY